MEYPRNDRFCPVCRSLRKEALTPIPLNSPSRSNTVNAVENPTSLAMVYSPKQAFDNLYETEKALARGTLFAELDKPFSPCRR